MASLLKAQQEGKEVDDVSRLRLDAGVINRRYPEDSFPGHAAWLDWPWKLHRIEKGNAVKFELYNLAKDAMEENDLTDRRQQRVASMKAELKAWLLSVVHSLNGKDY